MTAAHTGYTVLESDSNIEKPVLDDRQYKLIQLGNALNVLLIHDPSTDTSAASLDVNVGSFADKLYGIDGLAHFCEHLLFMGTEKYPRENEYSSYLAQHDGHSNAYTAAEHTNYYFAVNKDYLQGALDRFAQFFISPLFSVGCKDREINAVDSEHKKNLQDDMWRLHRLDTSTSNPEHPRNGFSTGNLKTLRDEPLSKDVDVRAVLIDFHKHRYSANLMTLVILGSESLDTLASWAEKMFSAIPNKSLPRPNYNKVPVYTDAELQKLIKAKPVNDSHKLDISFQIPEDLDCHWSLQPANYYSHLVGHEAKGSLLHYTKLRGWATELGAGHYRVCQGTTLFLLNFELTPLGLENWKEVVIATFQYLQMVCSLPPQKWIWQEINDVLELAFKFRQKAEPANTTSQMSKNLHRFAPDGEIPPHRLLSAGVSRTFDPAEIERVGSFFEVKNMRVTLAAQLLTGLNTEEKWYGVEYSIDSLPRDLEELIKTAPQIPDLHLPIPNIFIPHAFDVNGQKAREPILHPYLIKDNQYIQAWHKQDDQFMVPKEIVGLLIHLPDSNTNAFTSTCSQLLAELLSDDLIEITYYASLVNLNVLISAWRDGLDIKISGYSDKVPALVEQVLERVLNFRPTETRFDALKFKLGKEYKNFGMSLPYQQITTHYMTIVNDKTYTYLERIAVLDSLNFADFSRFVESLFRGGAFSELLMVGSFPYEEAQKVADCVETKLKPIGSIASTVAGARALIAPRNYLLKPSDGARFEMDLQDPRNINSCIFYNFEIAPNHNERTRVLTDLLCTIIREPAFDQLRTKEQLGYVVFSGLNNGRTSLGFRFIIQSERSTAYLEYRIDEFLRAFDSYLNHDMTDEEFATFKDALKSAKLTKLRQLQSEFSRFNDRITRGHFDFDSHQRQVEVLRSVPRQELTDFYRSVMLRQSQQHGKLVLHLKSQCCPEVSEKQLVHCSVSNFMRSHKLELSSERMDTIMDENLNDYEALVGVIGREMGLGENMRQDMLQAIHECVKNPIPPQYPSGKLYTEIADFRSERIMGEAPVPTRSLPDYYYQDRPLHL